MKVYVVCQSDNCFFKGYVPSMNEPAWSGLVKRAAMWFDLDVAEDQAWDLNATEGGARWYVKEVHL